MSLDRGAQDALRRFLQDRTPDARAALSQAADAAPKEWVETAMGRLASGRDELEEITPLLESARLLRAAIPEDAHSLFFQSLSQEHRRLRVHTPLGRDAFLLHRIVGREELSRPYRYELEVLSAQGGIDPADLIGKPVAVEIEREDDDPRWLSGHVAELAHEGSSRGAEIYRLVLVPWLDLLERRSDCRIFQERSVPEILAEVFENAGFRDFETGFLGSYPTRGYCVQYRETDLAFVSRLMEEEGIFYFFRHTEKAHILVLADAAAAYREGPVLRTSSLHPASGLIEDGLRSFEHRWSLQTGRITRRDYNPDQPTFDLGAAEQSIVPVALARVLERYDYPGRYAARAEGRHVARARMEELETRYAYRAVTKVVFSDRSAAMDGSVKGANKLN